MEVQQDALIEMPFIVERDDIPAAPPSATFELETRPFLSHDRLGDAVRDAAAELAWVQVRHGQTAGVRCHSTPAILIVLHGAARLIGDETTEVEAGDIITLPAGHEYGFTDVSDDGLRALHVAFVASNASTKAKEGSLRSLLERNEGHARHALTTPFFRILNDGRLEAERARERFRGALRVFSDAFQTFLFTRQAMCGDEAYRKDFKDHLTEELGHNEMLKASHDPRIADDPTLNAASTWFAHRMFFADNVDKAVVTLALETAGYHFHSLADPAFHGHDDHEYFSTHAEADEDHKDLGLSLLEGQHSDTYSRLEGLLDESWQVLEVALGRIAELVEQSEQGVTLADPRPSEIREILPAAGTRRRSHG